VILLCGEGNPYSSDPEDAMLPWPREAAGNRMRLIAGMTDEEYLAAFTRRNLLNTVRWSAPLARAEARRMLHELRPSAVVALGTKVADAWLDVLWTACVHRPSVLWYSRHTRCYSPGRPGEQWDPECAPPEALRVELLLLPHPSGRNRAWDVPGAKGHAQVALQMLVRDHGVR
jgi:hypothetical protein